MLNQRQPSRSCLRTDQPALWQEFSQKEQQQRLLQQTTTTTMAIARTRMTIRMQGSREGARPPGRSAANARRKLEARVRAQESVWDQHTESRRSEVEGTHRQAWAPWRSVRQCRRVLCTSSSFSREPGWPGRQAAHLRWTSIPFSAQHTRTPLRSHHRRRLQCKSLSTRPITRRGGPTPVRGKRFRRYASSRRGCSTHLLRLRP